MIQKRIDGPGPSFADDDTAEILTLNSGQAGAYLHVVKDEATGSFRVPILDPRLEVPVDPDAGRGLRMAVVDTGVLFDHPWIKRSLRESVDLTGEGPVDRSGHGTAVTLMLLAYVPAAEVVNIRALDAFGLGTRRRLLDALDWVVRTGCRMVNMSVGVYTPGCQGDCDLCQKAAHLVSEGVEVVAAPGNHPNVTACPANAARFGDLVRTAGAMNLDTGTIEPYSGAIGPNGFVAPGTVEFVPLAAN